MEKQETCAGIVTGLNYNVFSVDKDLNFANYAERESN
jgi:hypothetical protein